MKIWHEKPAWVAKGAKDKAAALEFEHVRRVLVIKHAALGDLLLTRPFLVTLRRHLPNARITLSVISHYQNGTPHDLLDDVQVVPGKDRHAGFRERLQSYRAAGPQDLLFDISATNASFWISRLTPAHLKIGFRHKGLERYLYDVAVSRPEHRFEAETFLDQLQALGMAYDWPLPFAMPPQPRLHQRPYVLYFATASTPEKCWPEERFAALIDALSEAYPNYDHLVLSGIAEWERAVAERILGGLAARDNVRAAASGNDAYAVVAHANLVIANDTGIRHLAIAHGTPTVGIFATTQPFRYWPRFGCHEAVFNASGDVPDVDAVLTRATGLLDSLEHRNVLPGITKHTA